ncbi:MAG: Hpt domain-containing protein [Gammaproteobacteria bacterium]|nr:Hpt domain-containing protein [Gammaproteobacteria bacterium]
MSSSLDHYVLNQLHEDMGEDVTEVLDAFVESIEMLLADLNGRHADVGKDTISRWAHSIKSSAASIGMMKLSGMAEELEMVLKSGDQIDIDAQTKSINSEFIIALELLKREVFLIA